MKFTSAQYSERAAALELAASKLPAASVGATVRRLFAVMLRSQDVLEGLMRVLGYSIDVNLKSIAVMRVSEALVDEHGSHEQARDVSALSFSYLAGTGFIVDLSTLTQKFWAENATEIPPVVADFVHGPTGPCTGQPDDSNKPGEIK